MPFYFGSLGAFWLAGAALGTAIGVYNNLI